MDSKFSQNRYRRDNAGTENTQCGPTQHATVITHKHKYTMMQRTPFFTFLFSLCVLLALPLSLSAQDPVIIEKCKVCGKAVPSCAYKGKHPKCATCGEYKEHCAFKGNHPKCPTCGKLTESCEYGGHHPKCPTCDRVMEKCEYHGDHPKCTVCGKVREECPYVGSHPKCVTCGEYKERCPHKGNHPKCAMCGKLCEECPYGGNHPTTGQHEGHEWVDLGLSVKWATCNEGAASPAEYGNYYAWGEITTHEDYRTSATSGMSLSDIKGDATYDAARAKWGGKWRMPTMAEFEELMRGCDNVWVTQDGVPGMRFTSKKNGKSIFFPAAGYREGKSVGYKDEVGYFWASTPHNSNTHTAGGMSLNADGYTTFWSDRSYAQSVRPVME